MCVGCLTYILDLDALGVECSVNSCCDRVASGVVAVSAYWIRSYVDLRASAGVKRNISGFARELTLVICLVARHFSHIVV